MPGVYKRKSDRARGKAGKWTAWWTGENGKQHSRAAFTDKGQSLELAFAMEAECRRVREGLTDPGDRARREAGLKPVADHVEDYRLGLLAKGDTPKHCLNVRTVLVEILADAGIGSVADLDPVRIRLALGRLSGRRSARTCNKAIGYLKAFASWLVLANRIKEVPAGVAQLDGYNEDADRRYERRAVSRGEIALLLAAAEQGPPFEASRGPRKGPRVVAWITGPERATLYRLAMGTGFRAEELRTLTPERFHLDGDKPTITVLACYAKNGKQAVQPITPEMAAGFRPFIAGRERGKPVITVPAKTAKMLRRDLAAAGIPPVDSEGKVIDFHALRHSYITHLVRSGANPKVVQTLARHSSITLTLDRYCHVEDGDLREALARGESGS